MPIRPLVAVLRKLAINTPEKKAIIAQALGMTDAMPPNGYRGHVA
jgi:hypothetical protein